MVVGTEESMEPTSTRTHVDGICEVGSKARVLVRIAVANRSGVTERAFLSQ
jgi:hypothetical protein